HGDVLSGQTGVAVSTQAEWDEHKARHAANDALTADVAEVLTAGGVNPFRDGEGFALVGLVSGKFKPTEQEYRRIHFLPTVAASLRAEIANALDLYLALNGRYARYAVMTTGQRCTVSDVRSRLVWLHRTISRWHHEICAPLGIEVLFRAAELPCDDAETFHVHANVIYAPSRYLRPREWRRFLRQTRAHFGTHWHDNGKLEDVREAVKYVMKGDQVARLAASSPAVLVALYHQLAGLHLVQGLGPFRDWRRALADVGQKVVAIHELGGRKLIAVKRRERRPEDEPEASAGDRLPATNRILSFGLPRAVFGPRKEPVALVERLDIGSFWRDPLVAEHARRAVHDWTAKGLLPLHKPAVEASGAFTVHTSTTTDEPAEACAGAREVENDGAYG
ncbi:hypothetical protein LCGC14_2877720, partial [marine sediment metagenome]